MSIKPKVALSQDFLLNLARLPATVQGKVLKWAIRFQTDPTASGFNYEKIRAARDPHLQSIRIDGDWRGIVFVPPRSDLYVLLYVDHHDEAYRWAEYRKLTINPVTGSMQVVLAQGVATLDAYRSARRAGRAAEPSQARCHLAGVRGVSRPTGKPSPEGGRRCLPRC